MNAMLSHRKYYNVSTKAILFSDYTQLSDISMSMKSEVLTRCQACDLYLIGEALLVWLR